jgi:glutaredoxin
VTFTIYSRPGCHLCDEMKRVIARAIRSSQVDATLDEIDISGDPTLEAAYGLQIPVLMIDGKKVAKYRVTEAEVARMMDARNAGAGGAGTAGGPGGAAGGAG